MVTPAAFAVLVPDLMTLPAATPPPGPTVLVLDDVRPRARFAAAAGALLVARRPSPQQSPATRSIWYCQPLEPIDGEPTWEDAEWQ